MARNQVMRGSMAVDAAAWNPGSKNHSVGILRAPLWRPVANDNLVVEGLRGTPEKQVLALPFVHSMSAHPVVGCVG